MKIELNNEQLNYLKSLPPADRKEAEEDLRFLMQEKMELLKEDLDIAILIINAISHFFNNINPHNMLNPMTVPIASSYDYYEKEFDKSLSMILNNKISLDDLKCDEKFKRLFNKFITKETVRIFTCRFTKDINININLSKLIKGSK